VNSGGEIVAVGGCLEQMGRGDKQRRRLIGHPAFGLAGFRSSLGVRGRGFHIQRARGKKKQPTRASTHTHSKTVARVRGLVALGGGPLWVAGFLQGAGAFGGRLGGRGAFGREPRGHGNGDPRARGFCAIWNSTCQSLQRWLVGGEDLQRAEGRKNGNGLGVCFWKQNNPSGA